MQDHLGRRELDPYLDLPGRMLSGVVDQVAPESIELLPPPQHLSLLDRFELERGACVDPPGQVPADQLGQIHGRCRSVRIGVQPCDQHNSGWINQQLAAAAKRYPRLRIVRWAEFLTARPARLHSNLRDGVHTSVPTGQDARNELIVDALTQPG